MNSAKNLIIYLAGLIYFACPVAVAQDIDNTNWKPALPYKFLFGDVSGKEKLSVKQAQWKKIHLAENIVMSYPPAGSHLYHWTNDRAILANKTLVFGMVTAKDQLGALKEGVIDNVSADARTTAIVDRDKKQMSIYVFLYLDKLLLDDKGRDREDAIAATVLALATEAYGNVQYHLEQKIADTHAETPVERLKREIFSLEKGGLAFAARFQATPQYRSMPANVRTQFENLVKKDENILADLKKALADATK